MTYNLHHRPRRLTVVATAAAAALPLLIALPGTAQAADAASCVAGGPTHAVNSAGSLLQYKLKSPIDGAGGYVNPTTIGSSWNLYPLVLSGPHGKFYLFKADGTYYGRRDNATGTWPVSVRKITSDFGWLADAADRNQVTVDRSGRMWVLLNNGQLNLYQYDGSGDVWNAASTGGVVDTGWNRYDLIAAADDGVIYGRSATDGKLYRSRYDATSQRWTERHVEVSTSDWRQFKSLSSNGGDTLLAVKTTGEAYYYRFDENNRTWPVNRVQVGTSGWQNLLSVSAAPDSCKILASHTPAAPARAQETYTRASVMQSSTGSLEIAYTDNIGRLVHGRMKDASNINDVQWTTLSGNENAFTGQPSLAEHTDGRVVVSAHNTSGSVWQRNQTAKSAADWGSWTDLAGAMAQQAVTAKTPSGLLAQFAADKDGKPWYRLQAAANGSFKGWMPLAGTGFTGPFTTVVVQDGIQLFGKDASGLLSTALFKDDGTLSAWTPLGAQAITGTPAPVVYPGYRIRVFATDPNGTVVSTTQSTAGGAYGDWTPVGDLTAKGSPSAVISPLNGITEIVVRGADDTIYSTGETTQGSGAWRTWRSVSVETAATEPTAFAYTNASGPTWAYSFRTADNQTRIYQVQQ